jgi:hypothetical protein
MVVVAHRNRFALPICPLIGDGSLDPESESSGGALQRVDTPLAERTSHDVAGEIGRPRCSKRTHAVTKEAGSDTCGNTNAGPTSDVPANPLLAKGAHLHALDGPAL